MNLEEVLQESYSTEINKLEAINYESAIRKSLSTKKFEIYIEASICVHMKTLPIKHSLNEAHTYIGLYPLQRHS